MYHHLLKTLLIVIVMTTSTLKVYASIASAFCELEGDSVVALLNKSSHFDNENLQQDPLVEECCSLDCCGLNCICAANGTVSLVYLDTQNILAEPSISRQPWHLAQFAFPTAMASTLYRPPIQLNPQRV